jgi:hypothetical protein
MGVIWHNESLAALGARYGAAYLYNNQPAWKIIESSPVRFTIEKRICEYRLAVDVAFGNS